MPAKTSGGIRMAADVHVVTFYLLMLKVTMGNLCSDYTDIVLSTGCQSSRTLRDRRDYIQSGMYPTPTAPAICEQWHIVSYGDQVITISFEDFDISPPGVPCNATYVLIGPEPCAVLCGSRYPLTYISTRSDVTITYVYRESGPSLRRGFFLKYIAGAYGQNETCLSDEFTCVNGKCILESWQCNGVDECGDGSDEVLCTTVAAQFVPPSDYACGKNSFGCVEPSSGVYRCFHNDHKCDGIVNCVNASDEYRCGSLMRPCRQWSGDVIGWLATPSHSTCSTPGCHSCTTRLFISSNQTIQFRFRTFRFSPGDYIELRNGTSKSSPLLGRYSSSNQPGRVIPVHSQRVYVFFYSSGNSTFNVTYQPKGTCLMDQLPCALELDCYSESERCDGLWDCPLHGSDERNCRGCGHSYTCGPNSRQCYKLAQRCNGVQNCLRGTDELHCSSVECGHHNGTFLCDSGLCVRESSWCDGRSDCSDGSDEMSCPLSTKVVLSAVVGSLTCALLLVIALGITYRLYVVRVARHHRPSRHVSPITAIEEQIYARQSAPPPYQEAMATSRPFDEVQRELIEESNAPATTPDSTAAGDDVADVVDATSTVPLVTLVTPESSDDDLLDVGVDDVADDVGSVDTGGGGIVITALGCLAQWSRRPKSTAVTDNLSETTADSATSPDDPSACAPASSSVTSTAVDCPTDTACGDVTATELETHSVITSLVDDTEAVGDDDDRLLLIS